MIDWLIDWLIDELPDFTVDEAVVHSEEGEGNQVQEYHVHPVNIDLG